MGVTMNYSLRIFLSVLFISLFIYSCKEDDKPTKSNTQIIDIQSIVVDSDNNPIIGAEVQVFENDDLISTDTTTEDGTIIFNEIEANIENLRLLLSHPFYQNLSIKYSEFIDLENIVLELDEDCCVKAKLVIKDKNDEPLKGATVQLRDDGMKTLKKGMSNEDGVVEFEGVCKAEFEFRISKDGYKVIEEIVEFTTCDETYEYSFELNSNEEEDCCESALIFKPKNEDGEILNGTKVYIYKNDKIIEDPVVKDGKAFVDGLCEGEYVIVYKNDKYETKEVVVELGCDEEKTVEHTLTKSDDDCCEATLKFLVKDAKSKEYISGASVTLKLGNDVIFENRKTNNDGYVIEDGLCKGEYTVIIEMDGYKTIETTWNVEKCDDFQEHFWLEKEEEDCCESALIFKPKNEDGEILNGTKVYIYKNDKIIEDPVVKDGKAVVDGLCEGEYVIVYKNDKYETKEVVVELGCDEEKTVEHTLTKKDEDCCEAILKFLVKDAKSKEYISGASVTLKLGNDVIFENRKTNNDGYVIEDGLCKGEYTVIIEMDGYKTIETTWNVEKCDDFQEHFWLEKE